MDAANNQRWMDNPNRNCAVPLDAEPDDVNNHAEQWFPTESREHTWARKLCAGCPVKTDCFNWAMTDKHDTYGYPGGVLGGTSETERAAMRNEGRVLPPGKLPAVKRDACGTVTGQTVHRKNGEMICVDCRDAWNAYRREWRRKRAESAA